MRLPSFDTAGHGPKGIVLFVVAALSFGLGQSISRDGEGIDTAICNTESTLLNPYLRCEPSEDLQKQEYTIFKENLEALISNHTAAGRAESVAVYFRDLENGPWFGIEPDMLFSPASMLKLPILVGYYKHAEQNPELLHQEIQITGEASTDEDLFLQDSVQPGETLTIDELLNRMMARSDNTATEVLLSFAATFSDEDMLAETLAAMGIAKSEGSTDDFLTVKRYSSFYRSLYNASYLNKEMSQKALDLLSRTTFHQGIDDGVPAGVTVAHKYGIRREGKSVQLHDCGIVYHPGSPYILCIMTKGDENDALASIIQEISQMVYDEVDSRN